MVFKLGLKESLRQESRFYKRPDFKVGSICPRFLKFLIIYSECYCALSYLLPVHPQRLEQTMRYITSQLFLPRPYIT